MREVETAQQLDHKCIIKMYECQQVEGLLFYTMEYIEGISLFHWMHKRGKMGLGSVVRVLSLLCHALEHAHTITIHRDISPDNVMVLKDGSIKLMDFGLAKLTNVESNLTMIGVSLGKQQYMAPEQRISAADVDYRADLYSIGVMFFELLTGELPSSKNSFSALRPDLPAECDEFAKKAMAHDPAGRFQSARDMREALMYLYKLHTGEAKETPPPFDMGDAASAQEVAQASPTSNLPPMSAKPTSGMLPGNVPTPPPLQHAPVPRRGLVGIWDRVRNLFRR
jgi:serine/threonine-protein kinase